jgi:hypothetical protein
VPSRYNIFNKKSENKFAWSDNKNDMVVITEKRFVPSVTVQVEKDS